MNNDGLKHTIWLSLKPRQVIELELLAIKPVARPISPAKKPHHRRGEASISGYFEPGRG